MSKRLDYEDIVSTGTIGLINAVCGFDNMIQAPADPEFFVFIAKII